MCFQCEGSQKIPTQWGNKEEQGLECDWYHLLLVTERLLGWNQGEKMRKLGKLTMPLPVWPFSINLALPEQVMSSRGINVGLILTAVTPARPQAVSCSHGLHRSVPSWQVTVNRAHVCQTNGVNSFSLFWRWRHLTADGLRPERCKERPLCPPAPSVFRSVRKFYDIHLVWKTVSTQHVQTEPTPDIVFVSFSFYFLNLYFLFIPIRILFIFYFIFFNYFFSICIYYY